MRDRPTYFDPIQNYALAEWDALGTLFMEELCFTSVQRCAEPSARHFGIAAEC